jgi:Flp pilus assembly protein CpaB
LSPTRLPIRRRLRVALWRARFLVAAACLGLAAATALQVLAPAPEPTVEVLVAAHDLTAGTTLTGTDVVAIRLPAGAGVAGSSSSAPARADLVGATVAVAVPAGMPLVGGVIAGGELAGPAGTVVTAVRLADDAVARLLAAGDHVDLLAAPADGGGGTTVAGRALVMSVTVPDDGSSGLLAGGGDTRATLVLAVRPDEAAAVAGAAGDATLIAVVVQ